MFELLRRTKKYSNDGTCNAVPGWEITLNPTESSRDPNCRLHPEMGEAGLGSGSAFGDGPVDPMPAWAHAAH
eukprot:CAMPEP_0172022376 /NCGR_PEP_ID=MMETSP1041-20130122/14230_1 /TAXON_ID=464988 /ORGANISM="Hemiselmis andersenii, Strain CCMP439" /LENGTH=71 /DNA_ID=CAMNT_0012677799 /DNA_START=6 /DNA_END=221 /DNA_ORIENTATION=+